MATMILHSSLLSLTSAAKITSLSIAVVRSDSSPSRPSSPVAVPYQSLTPSLLCSCGRRHLIQACATALLPISPSHATPLLSDSTAMLNRVHPPRPDWYEELYAAVLDKGMEAYEAEIAGYKSQLFSNLSGKAKKVLEIGIGTGPNLKYYANGTDIEVFGIDPNMKMEKYAKAAAVASGLPPTNFKFIHAVGEALPLSDAAVDAVVGTLVLCSVKDVDTALKEVKRVLKPGGLYLFVEHVAARDGTVLRFLQNVLDPLQQTVSDGCHLTRETGKHIFEAGFSGVNISSTSLRNALVASPHVYGIACK